MPHAIKDSKNADIEFYRRALEEADLNINQTLRTLANDAAAGHSLEFLKHSLRGLSNRYEEALALICDGFKRAGDEPSQLAPLRARAGIIRRAMQCAELFVLP